MKTIGIGPEYLNAGARARQRIAVAASLGLHGLLFAGFLIAPVGASGGLGGQFARTGSGAPVGDTMTVSLVSLSALAAASRAARTSPPTSVTSTPLDRLMTKAAEDMQTKPLPGKSPSDRTAPPRSLDRLIAEADREARSKSSSQGRTTQAGASGNTGSRSGNAGAGDLYAQVDPCWRRALDTSRVPVSLEVQLNAKGLVAGAPHVIRAGAGDHESTRIAVERALQAVAACLPYKGARSSSGRYVLDFGLTGR